MNKKALIFVIATSVLALIILYANTRIAATTFNYLSTTFEMPFLSVLFLPEVIVVDVLLIIFGTKYVYKVSEKIAPRENSDRRYEIGGAVTIILAVLFLFFWFLISYDTMRYYYHINSAMIIEYILGVSLVAIPIIIYGIVLMKKNSHN